ncbi:FAD-dependent monooxygenase [Hymenobacter sp. GOD-10R]|uniref:FAD-dependent monooxygenase n=1 Tax=Hymenobacter sp. GOD-10R TaxID=3093922 RepID=UPI002D77EEF3|nr:FAD-dependent monooxygenase [Hymenobacter sp. GOD-10R]WRQ30297.1 FAD-dependent monooxygenase [Hymenobacter sp. GOD-10R]
MKSATGKKVLVSGASIAGLSTAYWLNKLGYYVTVVELANEPRLGGAAINVQGEALASAKRMGIFEQLKASRLQLERLEFKNADDVTEGSMVLQDEEALLSNDIEDIEIERDKLVPILVDALRNEVDFLFHDRITALRETADAIQVTFDHEAPNDFHLVFGCDGAHSGVRKLWFDNEPEYVRFLEHYFSLTIVNTSLIEENTAQLYNVPGKGIMLNAYNGKSDIIFWFFSEKEISYDYRDAEQHRKMIVEQFAGQGWRTAELLEEVKQAKISYFDKFCQVRMPSWTKGRVALVGDAGYCASPAAGVGASLAMTGAAAVAEALEKHDGNFGLAFQTYNQKLRPFIEEVQANALTMLSDYFVPKTEEAIHARNTQGIPF